MSADPNKKSARTFQCRDVLWDTFEQLARELECSVDYLINEAMKHYARQRSQSGPRTPHPTAREPSQPQATQVNALSGSLAAQARGPAMARGPAPAPLPPAPAPLPPPPARAPAMARPPTSSMPIPPPRSPSVAPPSRTGPPPIPGASPVVPPPIPGVPRSMPPPPAAPAPAARSAPPRGAATNGFPAQAPQAPTSLTLVYNGDRYPVTKDRFVIGRGKQTSDLTLKDPNVSRQHALVEFQNGVYFMVDMGSTNGVAFNGQRIARKPIAEGDIFRICDHDLMFTYS